MGHKESFCLKWNEFEANIRDSFRDLREKQIHCDVTLATDDGHQMDAHKLILSAGSNFFRDIFLMTKHSSPLIYLKGIKRMELESVIEFMYNGEASVAQNDLNMFLETAKELQVKGLQSSARNTGDQEEVSEPEQLHLSRFDKAENNFKQIPNLSDSMLEPDLMEEKMFDSIGEVGDDFAVEATKEKNAKHELTQQLEDMMEKNDGFWKCKTCGKTANKKQVMRAHAETHSGLSFSCHVCSRTCTTRNSLYVHIFRNHSQSN